MTVGKDETLVVRDLNIHSGDLQELKIDFPGSASRTQAAWNMDDIIINKRYPGGDFLYDFTLKRVLYPKGNGTTVLYDTEKELELAAIQLNDGGMSPAWSPDGRFVVITSKSGVSQGKLGDEFFITSREGPNFAQLTYLGNTYAGDSIKSYSWSPDNSRIAFWMKSPDTEEYSLAIADVTSGDITNYCITGLATSFSINLESNPAYVTLLGVRTGKPVWSPDGTKLLISQWDPKKKNINVFLVDLTQQAAYPFAKDLDPIGWMSNKP
jgi:Tol biopolymer transport system component